MYYFIISLLGIWVIWEDNIFSTTLRIMQILASSCILMMFVIIIHNILSIVFVSEEYGMEWHNWISFNARNSIFSHLKFCLQLRIDWVFPQIYFNLKIESRKLTVNIPITYRWFVSMIRLSKRFSLLLSVSHNNSINQ